MSAAVKRRLGYVRHLAEVGAPVLRQLDALEGLVEEQRRLAAFLTCCRWAWERRDFIILAPYMVPGAVLYTIWLALKWAILKINRKPWQ